MALLASNLKIVPGFQSRQTKNVLAFKLISTYFFVGVCSLNNPPLCTMRQKDSRATAIPQQGPSSCCCVTRNQWVPCPRVVPRGAAGLCAGESTAAPCQPHSSSPNVAEGLQLTQKSNRMWTSGACVEGLERSHFPLPSLKCLVSRKQITIAAQLPLWKVFLMWLFFF